MAGERPAVIGEEGVKRIQEEAEEVAKEPHISPWVAADRHLDRWRSTIIDNKPDRRIKAPMANRRWRCYGARMASFLSSIILPIALAAVAVVLMLGLINMMR